MATDQQLNNKNKGGKTAEQHKEGRAGKGKRRRGLKKPLCENLNLNEMCRKSGQSHLAQLGFGFGFEWMTELTDGRTDVVETIFSFVCDFRFSR